MKPGVCGICGVAVVQPSEVREGWTHGHLFDRDGALVRVRCMPHKERDDPRYYDREGNIREDRFCAEAIA